MIKYKNISFSAKTFYGVKFAPGETKEVSGYINSNCMVRVFDDVKSYPVKDKITEEPASVTPRKKRKSNEPEKDSNAETEIKLEAQEETPNGNPS